MEQQQYQQNQQQPDQPLQVQDLSPLNMQKFLGPQQQHPSQFQDHEQQQQQLQNIDQQINDIRIAQQLTGQNDQNQQYTIQENVSSNKTGNFPESNTGQDLQGDQQQDTQEQYPGYSQQQNKINVIDFRNPNNQLQTQQFSSPQKSNYVTLTQENLNNQINPHIQPNSNVPMMRKKSSKLISHGSGGKKILGESKIQYVPIEKTVIVQEPVYKVEYVPKEVKQVEYVAVETVNEFIPKVYEDKYIEYVPQERTQKRVEYEIVQKQVIHSNNQQQLQQIQQQQQYQYQQQTLSPIKQNIQPIQNLQTLNPNHIISPEKIAKSQIQYHPISEQNTSPQQQTNQQNQPEKQQANPGLVHSKRHSIHNSPQQTKQHQLQQQQQDLEQSQQQFVQPIQSQIPQNNNNAPQPPYHIQQPPIYSQALSSQIVQNQRQRVRSESMYTPQSSQKNQLQQPQNQNQQQQQQPSTLKKSRKAPSHILNFRDDEETEQTPQKQDQEQQQQMPYSQSPFLPSATPQQQTLQNTQTFRQSSAVRASSTAPRTSLQTSQFQPLQLQSQSQQKQQQYTFVPLNNSRVVQQSLQNSRIYQQQNLEGSPQILNKRAQRSVSKQLPQQPLIQSQQPLLIHSGKKHIFGNNNIQPPIQNLQQSLYNPQRSTLAQQYNNTLSYKKPNISISRAMGSSNKNQPIFQPQLQQQQNQQIQSDKKENKGFVESFIDSIFGKSDKTQNNNV